MSKLENVFKSVSDERLVIDVLVPGFTKDMLKVKTAHLAGGKIFKIVVEGKWAPRKNKAGDEVPALAFDKYIEDFKYEFADISDDEIEAAVNFSKVADDRLFKSSTFFTEDYQLDKAKWSLDAGVLRISIPKKESALGVALDACDNADADSTGVVKSEAPAGKKA